MIQSSSLFQTIRQTPIFGKNFHSMETKKEKATCDNCGTQTTKINHARHKESCSAGTLYSTQCPIFSTVSCGDLRYHIAKKYSAPKPDITFKCKLCYLEFPGFYDLRQNKKL